jgi:hypothetical protein
MLTGGNIMKIRRFLSSMLLFVMLLGIMAPNIAAAEKLIGFEERVEIISIEDISEEEMKLRENQRENINLSEENPIQPWGTKPPTKTWDLTKDGVYEFSGSAERSSLYSDYILKSGGDGFEITVSNYLSEDLYVKVNNRSSFGQEIEKLHVRGNKKVTFKVYTSKKIELQFSIPCDTSGSVSSLN